MRINHNIAALNTYNKLGVNNNAMSKNMEKLSSGLRINRAGDDAAGLSISEKMRAQIRGLDQASKNAQDGISLIQTAEGGLNETHDILQRMNELATQAANGTLEDDDRQAIGDELSQLTDEIDRIAKSANFNGKNLLDGNFGVQLDSAGTGIKVGSDGVSAIDISGAKASSTFTLTSGAAGEYTLTDTAGNAQNLKLADNTAGTLNFDSLGVKITLDGTQTAATVVASTAGGGTAGEIKTTSDLPVSIQIGANTSEDERLGISIGNMTASSLGVSNLDVSNETNARTAMDNIKTAITTVSAERSKMGAYQNRLEHSINNLNTTSENLTSAESRIRDVDMAKEMMEQTKNSILAQASQAMLTQANQQPQNVLQMLR
ncbi:flagellin N-terminal helical domain-containing protein [Priestia endophytica]|uniref:Flagellin n=1 Tax=Priestia endophytica DSM 13796 TaxID=1121089 RepID=A0A1I6AA07_9BACI|nr:flagellin [Priestia endophytica]KYG27292.1 flagellin [Priestia endophytica]SFQ65544.1 flagellin [Priestia endophytica DSM 13796]